MKVIAYRRTNSDAFIFSLVISGMKFIGEEIGGRD